MLDGTRRLILFDVDGTLISTAGRAGAALGEALLETFGTAGPIATFRYSGKTDPQIVYELMALAGVPREGVTPRLPEVFERYLSRLREVLRPDTVRVLPGARELLERLRERPEVRLGLLTGNIAPGAAVKLGAAGLADFFVVGAFGSDDEDRNALVAVARRRAAAIWGEEFPGASTVVVGDAEADIVCARAGGARAVAVVTGWTTREALAALRPDALLDTLQGDLPVTALLDGGS